MNARERITQLLDGRRWIFAKTMPQNPHDYTLRREWGAQSEFDEVVRLIRFAGVVEQYEGRLYTVINLNGWKYWTMGAPIPETILINRKRLPEEPAAYDAIAASYDALWQNAESEAENVEIVGRLSLDGAVLDVGCGTGLLLDYASPANYTGLDPSGLMLERLREKHPAYSERVHQQTFEAFAWTSPQRFDSIVALFGAASYVEPAAWVRLPALLKPGGTFFLMFYAARYLPLTYRRCRVSFPHHAYTVGGVPLVRSVKEWGNFVLAEGVLP